MLTARWTTDGLETVDDDVAPLPDDWARLQVTGCGICGSDLHVMRGIQSGELAPTDFAVPGHEIAGTVVDGPAGIADELYAVEPWVSCRSCIDCHRGEPMLCEDGELLGISVDGGLAELVDVPSRLLHPVDASLPTALASLAEPWAVSVRAVNKSRITEIGERVLILGGGSIGLLSGLAAREQAAVVGVTCRYPHQADLATRFGLQPIDPAQLDEWADEHQPGVVIETVGGEADTMTDAVTAARRGGRIVVVGVFGPPRPTDYREIVLKELEVVGSFIYGTVGRGSEFAAAVDAMPTLVDELSALQTHHFPLTEAPQAFTTAADKSSLAVKVTIGAEATSSTDG